MFIRIALLTLLLSFAVLPVQAGPAQHPLLIAYNTISLDAAVEQVREQTGGQILTAETVVKDNRQVHRIKVLLPDGTVKVILINAE